MLYNLGYLRELVSPFVLTGGSCPDANTVRNRINEAIRRLLSEGRADWDQTQRRVRLKVQNGLITLPREFEAARLAAVDRSVVDIFNSNYQYLEGGPGIEMSGEHYKQNDLIDAGSGWPTFFDLPDNEDSPEFVLFAASTSSSDLNKQILVTGRKRNGDEVVASSGVPGYVLNIAHWDGGSEGVINSDPSSFYSTVSFTGITSVSLPPARKGYVSFYGVNPATKEMFFLGKYHPDETIPGYRRYGILSSDKSEVRYVDLLCKVAYLPATRDDDVLLIQNPDAIKSMVMAIREENAGNVQASVMLEEKAIAQLARQLVNTRSADPILMVKESFGMGSIPQVF